VGQTEQRTSKPRFNRDSLHEKSNFLSDEIIVFLRGLNAMKIYFEKNVGKHVDSIIRSAKERIYIVSPFLSPYYTKMLIKQAKKGIKVRIITSGSQDSLPHQKSLAILNKWKQLLPNLSIGISEEFVHAKMFIIDSTVITGSANLTLTGMRRNIERIEIHNDPEYLYQSEKTFHKLWSKTKPLLYDNIIQISGKEISYPPQSLSTRHRTSRAGRTPIFVRITYLAFMGFMVSLCISIIGSELEIIDITSPEVTIIIMSLWLIGAVSIILAILTSK